MEHNISTRFRSFKYITQKLSDAMLKYNYRLTGITLKTIQTVIGAL